MSTGRRNLRIIASTWMISCEFVEKGVLKTCLFENRAHTFFGYTASRQIMETFLSSSPSVRIGELDARFLG